jgi:LysR family transcriptional regulator for bpeEF and oprC
VLLRLAREYLQRYGAPSSIDDLKQHRCINYVYPKQGKPAPVAVRHAERPLVGLDIDAHMLINDGESVIQAAVAGLGIIQAPHVPGRLHAGPGQARDRHDRHDLHR